MLGVGVTTVMVAAQFLEAGGNILVKAATNNGMSNFVYIVYCNAFALFVLLPSTYFSRRKRVTPPITSSIICRIFLLSCVSCAVQIFLYTGIQFSSPLLASAMVDLVPAFTFILAIISRMEKLDLKLQSSKAKSIGTVVSITGALLMTLYKGLPLTSGSLAEKLLGGPSLSQPSYYWLIGGFLLAAGSFCFSISLIVQTWVVKDYPEELTIATISSCFVIILSAIIALIAEGNPKAWILRPDVELLAILYSATFIITTRTAVAAWACRKKGPVYVAMFNPIGMVITFGMGVIFLGDSLYLGSMIGAVIVAIGFYSVIWGQAQEEKLVKEKNEIHSFAPSSQAPLLQNRSMDL